MSLRIEFPSDTNLQIFVDKVDASVHDDWSVEDGALVLSGVDDIEDLDHVLLDDLSWLGGIVIFVTESHGSRD